METHIGWDLPPSIICLTLQIHFYFSHNSIKGFFHALGLWTTLTISMEMSTEIDGDR